MRKSKFLLSAMTAVSSLTLVTPMMCITSCGNKNTKYDALANKLQDEAIKIFKDVVCSKRHVSYKCHDIYEVYYNWIKQNLGEQYVDHDDFYDKAVELDPDHYEKIPGTDSSFNNIKFDIPASDGLSQKPMLILQAHMDMVEAVADGAEFGDKIDVEEGTEDGHKTLHSKDYKTSLGADNGAGVALMFAIVKLRNEFQHGPIRCIITADEEPGMIGPYMATKGGTISSSKLKDWVNGSKWMINIDNEDAGHLVKACSGGYSKNIVVNNFISEVTPLDNTTDYVYELQVKGLKSCHSAEVTENMINAIKVALGGINTIAYPSDIIKIINLDTPSTPINSTNSVVPTCNVTFTLNREYPGIVCFNYATEIENYVKKNYTEDQGCVVNIHSEGPVGKTDYKDKQGLTNDCSRAVIKLVDRMWFGPKSYLDPETKTKLKSSSNFGPMWIECNPTDPIDPGYTPFMMKYYSRSIDSKDMAELKALNDAIFAEFKNTFTTAEAKTLAVYDPWLISEKNEMIDMLVEFYKSIGVEPSVDIIHGGVENAWWVKLNPEIQTTSIGPTIKNAHSNKETLYIDTFVDEAKAILSVVDKLLTKE